MMQLLRRANNDRFYLRVIIDGKKYWVADYSNNYVDFQPSDEKRLLLSGVEARVVMNFVKSGEPDPPAPEVFVYMVPAV